MSSLLECYEILGVKAGAQIADITSSYRKLCRTYHPDINSDPGSGELMSKINEAYATIRKRFARDAILRERGEFYRRTARSTAADFRNWAGADGFDGGTLGAEEERKAFGTLNGYFSALVSYDYQRAYDYLSSYDKRRIARDSFIRWRTSVARMYTMYGFEIDAQPRAVRMAFGGRAVQARRFSVVVAESGGAGGKPGSEAVDKLVIREGGEWKVFLGHRDVGALAAAFEEKLEVKRRQDLTKRWTEYLSEFQLEYDMHSMAGLRKAMSRELYRQKRFGGTLTLAALAVTGRTMNEAESEALIRAAAATIARTLRETDIPAYIGGGVFLVLYVELKKKSAENIISRLAGRILSGAGERLKSRADAVYAFETWTGGNAPGSAAADGIIDRLRKKVLRKT